eukprot:scaffold1874_cov109-Isochrysis_galbana.AAC.2
MGEGAGSRKRGQPASERGEGGEKQCGGGWEREAWESAAGHWRGWRYRSRAFSPAGKCAHAQSEEFRRFELRRHPARVPKPFVALLAHLNLDGTLDAVCDVDLRCGARGAHTLVRRVGVGRHPAEAAGDVAGMLSRHRPRLHSPITILGFGEACTHQ